ncbi:PocR ligand-binding domain-containing protein [Carboxylicivirga sp. N1Y90]|uniref:PocR ligand-binding domain-containing protein n=1 Tax=Carboxylicivirga fragile TaxID=3417571 RepID=UPI003D357108|nr:PocR ligand-binding domain-containing protein [Marinilabiliaceae bacterium N1Y90]
MNDRINMEHLIKHNFEPLVIFKRSGYAVELINDSATSLFNLQSLDKNEIRLRHFCNRADLFNEKAAIRLLSTLELGEKKDFDWPVRLGNTHWLLAYLNVYEDKGEEYILVTFRDNTIGKESLLRLNNMVAFREVLDNLLSANTIVAPDEIPTLIDKSLLVVGQFFNCDRSYVFQFSEDLQLHSNINEWCANGITPYIDELQDIPIRKFPYLADHFLRNETVCLNDVSELPLEAKNEREEFAKEGIQSILLIPFSEGEKRIGFVGIDHVRSSKAWTASEVSNLKLLARAFANMLLRLKKEKELKEQHNMYQTLFMAANDSIAIFRNGICLDANPKTLNDFKCSRDFFVGKSLVELSSHNQVEGKSPSYINVFQQEALNGHPQMFEWVLKRGDGSEIEAEISLNKFSNKGESHTIAIFRDITEQNQAVKLLFETKDYKKTESQLLNLNVDLELTILDLFDIKQLQNLQDAFAYATGVSSLITDLEGYPITDVSFTNEICKLVRATDDGKHMCIESGKMLGKLAKEQRKPISRPCLSCGFIDAAAPIIVDGNHIGNWIIGQVRPSDLNVDKLLEYTRRLNINDDGVIAGFEKLVDLAPERFTKILNLLNVLTNELSILGYNNLKLAKSVQNHLSLERKLLLSKQRAEESDRLKSAFLANLSHEIRTPMNGIVGFSELLQFEGLTPADRREYVRLIHQSSSQLLNIINDIIDISKIESGQIDIHSSYFDVIELMENQEAFFIDSAKAKEIDLIFNSDDLTELEMFSDEGKLRQVLTNLISNAIKFTAQGSVEFGYELMDGNLIELFVQDSGTGIDADNVHFIFDRFWQAKDSDVKKGGTGLGLAITKAYVELLGGHINVKSKLNEGTRFSFVIPRTLN